MSPSEFFFLLFLAIIIHSTHYPFSDWSKAYSKFSKSDPGTSSSYRLYNNHAKDMHAWFLRVIMSSFARFVLLAVSEEVKTWLPGLLRWPSKTSKIYLKTKTHKRKEIDKGGKGAVCWLREREKTERTWGKERVGTNFENILCRSEKERIHSMYNKTIIRFGVRGYSNLYDGRNSADTQTISSFLK